MHCPTCDSVITHNTGVCSRCETPLDQTGARLNSNDEDVHLKSAEEKIAIFDERSNRIDAYVPPTEKTTNPLAERINHREPDSRLWGGFIRRACAFAVDWAMIL